ncbi:MAG: hypothetical protein AB7O99_05950 [Dongiaceae bacterium]
MIDLISRKSLESRRQPLIDRKRAGWRLPSFSAPLPRLSSPILRPQIKAGLRFLQSMGKSLLKAPPPQPPVKALPPKTFRKAEELASNQQTFARAQEAGKFTRDKNAAISKAAKKSKRQHEQELAWRVREQDKASILQNAARNLKLAEQVRRHQPIAPIPREQAKKILSRKLLLDAATHQRLAVAAGRAE